MWLLWFKTENQSLWIDAGLEFYSSEASNLSFELIMDYYTLASTMHNFNGITLDWIHVFITDSCKKKKKKVEITL